MRQHEAQKSLFQAPKFIYGDWNFECVNFEFPVRVASHREGIDFSRYVEKFCEKII